MSKMTVKEKDRIKVKRKHEDNFYKLITLIASSIGAVTLIAIFAFVFVKGAKLISWDMMSGDYYAPEYHLVVKPTSFCNCDEPENLPKESMYSSKWGIALGVTKDNAGLEQMTIIYIDANSPLYEAEDMYSEQKISINEGLKLNRISFTEQEDAGGFIVIPKYGLSTIITSFETYDAIDELYVSGEGGGIRGSLISTLYLIALSLLFALPIGIFTAIYLNEYAKKGLITRYLRQLIELLTGVPSIIFGLVGLVVFIPLTSIIGFEGKNLLAAALTMAIIILPTIIRSTEESLKVIPTDLRQASLALGANKTQTTFKVVLPNALPGILTAILLSIGRVIGESAALIFVLGTTINDRVSVGSPSTTLAVQIWSIMGGEVANFELASAISLIILFVVLVLNLSVKYISYRLKISWQ